MTKMCEDECAKLQQENANLRATFKRCAKECRCLTRQFENSAFLQNDLQADLDGCNVQCIEYKRERDAFKLAWEQQCVTVRGIQQENENLWQMMHELQSRIDVANAEGKVV